MTDHHEDRDQGSPPDPFVKQVKDALEHLYDFPHLQRHPLALPGEPGQEHTAEMPSQWLRRQLIDAIETLNPGADVPFRAPHARLYNLLHLHHVEGMTIQEAAHELGISVRQAYRDLRRGVEGVATVLWARRSPALPQEARRATEISSVQAEIDRLEVHPRPIDVCPLLQRAQKAVEQLATQRAVWFDVELSPEPVTVATDPTMVQQVLISALSHALQQARPGAFHLALKAAVESPPAETDRVSITLRYDAEPRAADAPVISPVVARLVDRLGWTVGQEARPEGARVVVFHLPAHGPTVLVIDDNAGLVQLLDRYFTDQACRVLAAGGGHEGLRLAQELLPDAVVLDVMMPEMDGWEILQRLRTHPQTAEIPIIICSVFDDPELAYSLGASLFLPKPVSRDDVLGALRKLGVV